VAVIFLATLVWLIKRIGGRIGKALQGILPEYPVRREAEVNREIYTSLVELRALTDADRAYVFRFHNGMEFLPSHPAWKLSCTHEVVHPGVSYESGKLQGLLVSLIPNIIGAVLTGTTSALGITIPKCPTCPFHVKCLRENKRVIIMQVGDMEGSYCKFHLESQNIKTAVLCGITQDGNVYGIVGLDFCATKLPDEKIVDVSQMVCRATEKIQYLMQYKRRGPADLPFPNEPMTK
jgi:hypothetical protein